MKAAIISKGQRESKEFYEKYLRDIDIIICADGGAEYLLDYKIIPNIIVGDFDSINTKSFEGIELVKYSKEKDETDTELALRIALDRGSKEIIFLSATGNRLDHTLANLSLLIKLLEFSIEGKIIDKNNIVYLLKPGQHKISNEKGTYCSLMSLTPKVTNISLEGFKYPLTNSDIDFLSPLGVSNQIIGEVGTVFFSSGILLVIKSVD
jgi:thiamine pyrophosphokinase